MHPDVTMECYDVAVIGAGPAGSSAALAACRAGARVLLLDRADFPRDKPCGDGITNRAFGPLERMGLLGHDLAGGSRLFLQFVGIAL